MNEAPPTTIFYSRTGGKSAPFYRTLGGIRSALKTTWGGQHMWSHMGGRAPKVYRGTVTWEELDPTTGEVIG